MNSFRRQDRVLLAFQIVVWVSIMLAPGFIIYLFSPAGKVDYYLVTAASLIGPFAFLYFMSFYLLIPRLLEKGRKVYFILAVICTIMFANLHFFFFQNGSELGNKDYSLEEWKELSRIGFNVTMSVMLSLDIIVIVASYLHRSYIQSHRREQMLLEEKQKTIEAELVWLKNQLNPHFLFNSLNNISSLVQIDPDRAQDSIAQLSDLLRYALYESQKPYVRLAGEVEFMQNYIAMMKLRCSDKTEVTEDFQIGTGDVQIVPLLFISFIENAFKHGTSSNQESHVSVGLHVIGDKLVFECRNTNFPKDENDHSGSGIGLENTRRRLDLCYPGKYTWEQKIENEEYCIKIEIIV